MFPDNGIIWPVIVIAPTKLPVTSPTKLPITSPDKLPVNVPAIAPIPVIVGDVNVLLVNVCVSANWTILLFVIEAILVAVSALPVTSPTKLPITLPPMFKSPVVPQALLIVL